jgi:hypothetical protein
MIKELNLGYDLHETGDEVYLFRPGAGVARGRIKPHDGWTPNFEEPVDYASQEERDAARDAFYAAIDGKVRESAAQSAIREMAEASRRERRANARGGPEAEGVAGSTEPGRAPGSRELAHGGARQSRFGSEQEMQALLAMADAGASAEEIDVDANGPKGQHQVTRAGGEFAELVDGLDNLGRGVPDADGDGAKIAGVGQTQVEGSGRGTLAHDGGRPLGGLTPIPDKDGNMRAAVLRLYAYGDGRAYNMATLLHETGHVFCTSQT